MLNVKGDSYMIPLDLNNGNFLAKSVEHNINNIKFSWKQAFSFY